MYTYIHLLKESLDTFTSFLQDFNRQMYRNTWPRYKSVIILLYVSLYVIYTLKTEVSMWYNLYLPVVCCWAQPEPPSGVALSACETMRHNLLHYTWVDCGCGLDLGRTDCSLPTQLLVWRHPPNLETGREEKRVNSSDSLLCAKFTFINGSMSVIIHHCTNGNYEPVGSSNTWDGHISWYTHTCRIYQKL